MIEEIKQLGFDLDVITESVVSPASGMKGAKTNETTSTIKVMFGLSAEDTQEQHPLAFDEVDNITFYTNSDIEENTIVSWEGERYKVRGKKQVPLFDSTIYAYQAQKLNDG